MNIVVTNDDGVDSPGLAALVKAARKLGRAVVVAPQNPCSHKSHSVTVDRALRVEQRHSDALGQHYVCRATPADCVRLALRHLGLGEIDWVLSGINRGGNAGVDVIYSGTVAAAREAALLGVPAVAISQLLRPEGSDNWPRATQGAIQALQYLAQTRPRLVNVNLGDPKPGEPFAGIKVCPLTLGSLPTTYESVSADQDVIEARYAGRYFDRPVQRGADFHYLINNWITLTPLLLDQTDHESLKRLADDDTSAAV